MPEVDTARAREVVANWLGEAKLFGERDAHTSKRAHSRYTWNRPMQLLIDGKTHYVYSRDITEEGMGLTYRERVPEGVRLHVRRDEADPWIPACVTHCTQTVGAYKVGVELVFELQGG